MMRILVTGASGFVGRHLVNALLQRGHHIVAVARDASRLQSAGWDHRVSIVEHDVALPLSDPQVMFGQLDAVAHLAWPGLPNYRDAFHFESNLPAAYRFLKALIQAGCRRVFVTGTCFEYGMLEGALDESMVTRPVTAYGLAKDCLFKFLAQLQNSESFQLTWGRLFYLHGEGQSSKSLLSQLQTAIDRNETQFPMSGGEQLRDYMPIQEATANIASLLEINQDIGAVNICSGQPVSVRSLVERWLSDHQRSIQLKLGHYAYVEYEPMAFWGSRKKLDQILNPVIPVGSNG